MTQQTPTSPFPRRKAGSALAVIVLLWLSPPLFAQSATQQANLLPNGDFAEVDPATHLPAGWTTQHPKNVALIDLGAEHGHVIALTGDPALMSTYGADLLSAKISFQPNTRYRVTGYTKSTGPNMIVFVKGYATLTHKEHGKEITQDEPVYQMRKEIPPTPDWQAFNLDLEVQPTKEFSRFQHEIKYLRVLLWAYWPVGTCWYSDIHLEEVGPVPETQRLHAQAVTHVGVKPRLSEKASATQPLDDPFDTQQAWSDAVNAFQGEQNEQALQRVDKLLAQAADNAEYHLLAARAAAKARHWERTEVEAQWLIAHAPEPYQRDWADVVLAQALRRKGAVEQAQILLQTVLDNGQSASAKQAARELLRNGAP